MQFYKDLVVYNLETASIYILNVVNEINGVYSVLFNCGSHDFWQIEYLFKDGFHKENIILGEL
jgi:hypothetical protein